MWKPPKLRLPILVLFLFCAINSDALVPNLGSLRLSPSSHHKTFVKRMPSRQSPTSLAVSNRNCARNEARIQNFSKRRSKSKLRKFGLLGSTGLMWASFSQVSNAASSIATSAPMPIPSWQLVLAAVVLVTQSVGVAGLQAVGAALQKMAIWYTIKLQANPLVVKSITAGVIGVVGDYCAQWLEYKLKHSKDEKRMHSSRLQQHGSSWVSIHGTYSKRRALSILTDGVFISGPLMHLGYDLFESILPVKTASGLGSSVAAVCHVIADSVILDSIFVASTFMVTGIMEGYTLKQLKSQLKSDYFPTIKASWVTSTALLPLEFICFRCLPVCFRVMAVNFIDVIWDAVISFMAHRNRNHHPVIQGEKTTTIDERIPVHAAT